MKTYASAPRSWILTPLFILVFGLVILGTKIQAQTLLAYYTFSNSSNIGQDSSGNGYDLALFKSPGSAPTQDTVNYPTSPAGITTSAYFNGTGASGGYVTLGTSSSTLMSQLSGTFTLSLSINPGSAFTGATAETLISTQASGNGFSLYLNSSGDLAFSFNDGGKAYTTSFVPTLNAWTQLTVTDDGANLTFYENGTIVGSAIHFAGNVTPVAPTAGLVLGSQAYNNAAEQFDGNMADVAIFQGALTSTQVAQLYTNGVSAIPEPAQASLIVSVMALAIVGLWRKARRN